MITIKLNFLKVYLPNMDILNLTNTRDGYITDYTVPTQYRYKLQTYLENL